MRINSKRYILYKAFDEEKSLQDWSKDCRCVVPLRTLRNRVQSLRWDMSKALTRPRVTDIVSDIKIGNKYNRLTVIGDKEKINNQKGRKWKCRCDCGNIVYQHGYCLKREISKSCGCLSREITAKLGRSRYLKDGEAAINELFRQYQYQAKQRNLKCSIGRRFFERLILGNCFYCNSPPSSLFPKRKLKTTVYYNGIDRIHPNIGYVSRNVVSCCKGCNNMKGNKRYEDFLIQIRKIYIHMHTSNIFINHYIDKYNEKNRAIARLLSSYKNNAKHENREWLLSNDEFYKLVKSTCFYCGETPNQLIRCGLKSFYFYNGIDRLNNEIGYLIDNCITCCSKCNFIKRNLEKDLFLNKIKEIYNHRIFNS